MVRINKKYDSLLSPVIIVFCILLICVTAYEIPDAEVIVFSPKGFQVSIPDEEGINLFAFHGKINEKFVAREAGKFAKDIVKPKKGRWIYKDKNIKLKVGDIIYYWTYVIYDDNGNKLGYARDNQKFVVQELLPKDGVPTSSTSTSKTTSGEGQCVLSATQVDGRNACQNELIFEENFDSWRPDLWTVEHRFAGAPDYEFVVYNYNPVYAKVESGVLSILPVPVEIVFFQYSQHGKEFVTLPHGLDLGDKCTGAHGTTECFQKPTAWLILPPVLSGRMNSKKSFSFTYGTVQIRAKLPMGDWIYPQLFLNSKSEEYGRHYDSGQINIAFASGNRNSNSDLSAGCILGGSVTARNYGTRRLRKEPGWRNEFHVYEMKWTPDGISVSVDGENYGNIYPPQGGFAQDANTIGIASETAERWRSGSKMAPFDKEMYLVIGVGVGGLCFPDSDTKPWKNNDPKNQRNFYKAMDQWYSTWGNDSALIVDYIKIFAV
ncbi:beta-1,3-glucan-binding protein-like [Agrilus planipennis]|uniref:Beta-1,3-glucan-binding protein-like n=1 Tax=Agrilus planipennis TaxID=224129 RepID=A0A1W4XSN8_AGRPL|nr:beta-1,3-glucan-binding protein-like [Agrilus planipennis]